MKNTILPHIALFFDSLTRPQLFYGFCSGCQSTNDQYRRVSNPCPKALLARPAPSPALGDVAVQWSCRDCPVGNWNLNSLFWVQNFWSRCWRPLYVARCKSDYDCWVWKVRHGLGHVPERQEMSDLHVSFSETVPCTLSYPLHSSRVTTVDGGNLAPLWVPTYCIPRVLCKEGGATVPPSTAVELPFSEKRPSSTGGNGCLGPAAGDAATQNPIWKLCLFWC